MEYLLISMIILAGYHLYVENVIVPTKAQEIRYDLLLLMKRLEREYHSTNSKEMKKLIQDINYAMIHTCVTLEEHNILKFLAYKAKMSRIDNKKNSQEVKLMQQVFNKNKSPEMVKIVNEYGHCIRNSFLTTAYAWSPFSWPIRLVLKFQRYIASKHKLYITGNMATDSERLGEYVKFEKRTIQTFTKNRDEEEIYKAACLI